MLRRLTVVLVASGLLLTSPALSWAISLGQSDTFQDGLTADWSNGFASFAPPQVIGTGGPAGAGDMYLQMESFGGSGANSKPTIFNSLQWIGDYTAAGVMGISVSMSNFGANPLDMRMKIGGAGGEFITSSHLALAAGSGWQDYTFSLAAGDLVGAGDVAATLADVTQVWFFHNPTAAYPGPAVATTLGLDNITAVSAVPEPTTIAALLGLGLTGAAAFVWQRRRRQRPADACDQDVDR